jgi:hypothetical protein
MDFSNTNASGSASFLVSYIKAFIGPVLRNKIIVIFDTDTAANGAIMVLRKIDIQMIYKSNFSLLLGEF